MAAENRRKFAWLESPVAGPPLPLTADSIAFVNVESKSVKHNMDTFAGDPDPGIQQLRGMLQRESATLALLSSAITDRAKAADAAATAGAGLERTRGLALADDHDLTSGWTDAASETDREAAAWVDYYQLLSKGAQGLAPPAAVPSAPAPIAASAEPAPRIVEPAPPPKPAITAVPLIRYTGAWTFPASNGLYHGPQPEFADLVVHEDNGHATGTLFARFKAAAATDPVLRFDFSGEFTNQRTQAFQLETSDGSKGMLELIPGPAFNLIEVNFQIESKPGKVRQANMVLVKK